MTSALIQDNKTDHFALVSLFAYQQNLITWHLLLLILNPNLTFETIGNGRSEQERHSWDLRAQQWINACQDLKLWCHHHLLVCPRQERFVLDRLYIHPFYMFSFSPHPNYLMVEFDFLNNWKGKSADVVLGFDSVDPYVVNLPNFFF